MPATDNLVVFVFDFDSLLRLCVRMIGPTEKNITLIINHNAVWNIKNETLRQLN